MITKHNGFQKIAMTLGVTVALGAVLPLTAMADTHHSIIHRHPNATGAVAGYSAYRAAKHTGHNRTVRGRHRNVFQRHPVATGVGAAVIAHHYAKKHR